MDSFTRHLRWRLLLLGQSMIIVASIGCQTEHTMGHKDEDYTYNQIHWLSSFLHDQTRESTDLLPRGRVADLEKWLNDKCQDRTTAEMVQGLFVNRAGAVVRPSPDGKLLLKDAWGRALVYRYPSDSPEFLFRLYSLGPRGLDENGKGGNIDGSLSLPRVR